METVFTRREKRAYLQRHGILKMKKRLEFREWSKMIFDNVSDGNKLHRENLDIWEKHTYENLQERETKYKQHLTELNLEKSEIDNKLQEWYNSL